MIYQVNMKFNTPTSTALYSIEETIKAYRKLSQKNISSVIPDITVDQALILIVISQSDKSQSEIADLVFKDYASMTRIVSLMISKDYLLKTIDKGDKRKTKLTITEKGRDVIKKLKPMIDKNRETALANISEEELQQMYNTLRKITSNCQINK